VTARTRRLLGIVLAALVSIAALFGVVLGGDEEPAPVAEDQPDGTGEASP
jgi:hypothetical protein